MKGDISIISLPEDHASINTRTLATDYQENAEDNSHCQFDAGLEPVGKWYTGPAGKQNAWNHMPNR